MTVTENVKSVKDKIAAAAISSGRKPEDIVLVAATKMNGADAVRASSFGAAATLTLRPPGRMNAGFR